MTSIDNPRGTALGRYIAGASGRTYPDEVVHEARRSLVDYLGLRRIA